MTSDRRALAFGLSAVLLWSTVATAFKLALRELDVLQLLAYSVSCSALVLLCILACQGRLSLLRQYARDTPGYFLVMGLVNPVLYYLVLLQAYALLPAQQAQAINYTWAITLALLAVPLLGHRLNRRDLLALALGYGGVLIIATRGQLMELRFDSLPGVGLALLSTVIWALYWLVSTRNRRDPVACLCLNFAVATPVALALCAVFSSLAVPGWRGLAAAAYVGVFEMGLTFALWSTALRLSSGVSRIGNLIFLSPLMSLVFIATILGEAIHPATLVGLALIIPGVLLQQRQPVAAAREA
ncbi:MAG: DMT family transporter [Halieaceae bacterium]|nr:DMT family transporter [Halieaceae bacterium]